MTKGMETIKNKQTKVPISSRKRRKFMPISDIFILPLIESPSLKVPQRLQDHNVELEETFRGHLVQFSHFTEKKTEA